MLQCALRLLMNEGYRGGKVTCSVAAWLSRVDRDRSLVVYLKSDLTPPGRAVAQVKGWIFGVA